MIEDSIKEGPQFYGLIRIGSRVRPRLVGDSRRRGTML